MMKITMKFCVLVVFLGLVAGTASAEETKPADTKPVDAPVTAPNPPVSATPPLKEPVSPGATAVLTPEMLKKQADAVNLAIDKTEAAQEALEKKAEAQEQEQADKMKKAAQDTAEAGEKAPETAKQ